MLACASRATITTRVRADSCSAPADLGNLVGPLQFQNARAVHPSTVEETTIGVVTVRSRKDFEAGKRQDFGRKYVVPYALFRGNFCYTPAYGERTRYSVEDLAHFVEFLKDPFSSRQSARLGIVTLRKAWIFLHDSRLGNMQPGLLDSRVRVTTDVQPPRLRDFTIASTTRARTGIKVYTEENLDAFVEEVQPGQGLKAA
jgi:Cas7 group CRISPR-associated protein Csh2